MKYQKSDLHSAAAGLLGSRVHPGIVKNPELAQKICDGLRKGRPSRNGTITMAQAIVLTLGIRALEGEKGAAEFLEKLAQQNEENFCEDVTVKIELEETGE